MDEIVGDFELNMPDDLILSEAISQISGANNTFGSKNYVDIFDKKHMIQRANRETDEVNDDDFDNEINHDIKKDLFYDQIIHEMKDKAGIMFDIDNNKDCIPLMYDMFVVRRHENISEFLFQYILANKQSLAASYQNDAITNMTVKTARKTYKNKTDATIIVHCIEIIQKLLNCDDVIFPENIVELLYKTNPEDYEYLKANSLMNICALSFEIPNFINNIRAIYSDPLNFQYLSINILERLSEIFLN